MPASQIASLKLDVLQLRRSESISYLFLSFLFRGRRTRARSASTLVKYPYLNIPS
jgi:hypothetical protein